MPATHDTQASPQGSRGRLRRKLLAPAIAGATALSLVGGVAAATWWQTSDVTLDVDGATSALTVRDDTVAELLESEGIVVGEHDVVLPSPDSRIVDGLQISIRYARPLEVSVDGAKRTVWTTARTVDEALTFLSLNEPDSKLSTSRSARIGREGLTLDVRTAQDVELTAGGQTKQHRVAGTVADLLASAGITPDGDDILTPAATTQLDDGLRVTFVDVEVTTTQREVAVAFEKKTVKSDKLDKGTSKVTTKGVEGLAKETVTTVVHDGKQVSQEVTAKTVLKKPVAQVTTVGTRVVAEPETSSSSSSTSTRRSGTKYDWMAAAGIAESDWQYVDYIVSKESGWNPSARNPSSGACGLVQALPCSKLGPNWSDPVVALKWQKSYVQSRYGGYRGAYQFWLRNHWY